ncbi:hypothetical protein D3C87_80720 [compost metagenome]
MKLKVDESFREPKAGDIFVVVSKNNHSTPYLISNMKNTFLLTNLHSGLANYTGNSIQELIENYTSKNAGPQMNPPIHYYFLKGHETTLVNKKSFGHQKLEVSQISRQELNQKYSNIKK